MKSLLKPSGLFLLSFSGFTLFLLLVYITYFMPRVGYFADSPLYVFFLSSMYALGISVIYTMVFAIIAYFLRNKIILKSTNILLIAAWNSFFLIGYTAMNLRHRNFFLITGLLLAMHLVSWALGCGLNKFKKKI